MSLRRSLLSVTCLGVALSFSTVALAKDEQAAQMGVADKKAEEYNAKGVRLGSFNLFPKVTVKQTHNDNIYKEKQNTSDDWITDIEPSLSLRSDWNQHSLRFDGKANIGRYADYGDNDYEDYELRARGTLDASKALTVKGDAKFKHGHEDRGGDDVGSDAKNPVESDTINTQVDVKYKPNRLGLQFTADYDIIDIDDNQTTAGGTTNNDDRDRRDVEGTLKVSYELKKGYEAYLKGSLNDRNYDDATDDNGVNRDSDGYKAQAGIAIDLSKLVRADIAAGYMSQDYTDNSLKDASGWSGDVDVSWFATPLTTVRGKVGRSIDETTTSGVSSTVGTKYGIGVDHEFLRNLRASADIKLSKSDYEGGTRKDDKTNYIAKIDYKLNRNFFAGASVDFEERDSNEDTNDYDKTTFMIKIGAQF
ncbi:outer membrane beta-barrel protein [Terasakiella sp. A23]|uniref:outer membrane beta-barrel protein n=1 Tax=Terasakiella sp. FCG-A23 TaxID=3080561 RepID=UPI002954C085|nr:outer membrane beta-barrel protein [Terasakiella sp. A23]MDV7339291.1 outer membrane beta-barrel protein [Terasakiella sp. A23]